MRALLSDPVLQAVLQACFSALFLRAAVHKLRVPRDFARTLADYRLLPQRAVPTAAAAIVGLELGVAGALLWPGAGPLPAAAGASLLLVYAAAMGWNLARGRHDLDCGCAGPGLSRAVGPELVVRNLVLAAILAPAALPASPRPLTGLDLATGLAAVLAATLLHAASEHVLVARRALRPLRREGSPA